MNIELSYLIGPLTGIVIGGFTNRVTIKLMLHPYEANYIFGMKIPFTPGLIPKERGRIAETVGTSISRKENSLLGIAFNAKHFLILLQEPAEHLLSKQIKSIILSTTTQKK